MKKVKNRSANDIRLQKTPKWKRTNTAVGHEPKFNIDCKMCGMPMALRHSTIALDIDDGERNLNQNQMCYKCPACAWFIRFFPVDDNDYCKKVIEWRDGSKSFVPTVDDWSNESDKIKQKLIDLGYWGGDVEYN